MVTSTLEQLSPTRVKLTITVPPEELKPSIAHAYSHIAQDLSVPGFRKGKVPPPIIDQRVGKEAVLEHAVSEGLDTFYQSAAIEHGVRPLGRPSADVTGWPSAKDFSGDLLVEVEVDVRPQFALPAYDGLEVTVDAVTVSADDVKNELDELRARFGTLVTVDRPAKTGDFVQIDLLATIGGTRIDDATGISYELGSGELLDGIDEALESLTAGESTTFASDLLGGDFEGEPAEISVTVIAVKERELPKADDDFAQIASEFDTIKELKASLKDKATRSKTFAQANDARNALLDTLLAAADIPVPEALVLDEVNRHLENESRLDDDVHRAEVTESTEKSYRMQFLLDAIAEAEGIQVGDQELTTYIVQASAQYGVAPQEYAELLQKNGQLPQVVGEVLRNKVLSTLLGKVKVVDSKGKKVDLSEFLVPADEGFSMDDLAAQFAEAGAADDHEDHEGHDHEGHDH